MQHLCFSSQPTYPIIFLVPNIEKEGIIREYLDPYCIPYDDVMVLDLHYTPGKKKTAVADMKTYIISELVTTLEDITAEYVLVADSEYFKVLTGAKKAESNLGYMMDSLYGSWKVIYIPNYRAVFYDPIKIRGKINQAMTALLDHVGNIYREPGNNIIKFAEYPKTVEQIEFWLDKLIAMDCPLTIDIEAFSLKHYDAGIATISFCWSQHEGIAFAVDYQEILGATSAPYGTNVINNPVRKLLIHFFLNLKQKAIYHNISYDVYVLIYQLFMDNLLDTEGLLYGIEVMLANWEDTKLITYLATNTCAGNNLSLKEQAQSFAGNYGQEEIKDITRIPLKTLLTYNLVDGLSTWFTYHTHWQAMIDDDQYTIYTELFKPTTVDIIQMQLTGLPINMEQVKRVKAELELDENKATDSILSNPLVQQYVYQANEDWIEWKNTTLKKKRVTLADADETFNPNSSNQVQKLLYEQIGLPVIALTDTKQPSTDKDTIVALRNHTKDTDVLSLLNSLIDYTQVNKILTSFIPAMENAQLAIDGWHYLYGNFNLGGTVSGRLSSSKPNLQNIPATGSKYAKKIKSCFQAAPGWLFFGLDFASLEDKISALTTKDPNKIRVYTDLYDGHCLRAYYYYPEQMPDIQNTVDSINSISKLYKELRQESKAPSFALTYQGTFITLMKNCGFTEEKAKQIEARYHSLYKVSTEWVQDKLNQASKDGYITAAFGLRVRTPLLSQVIRGNKKTPREAEAEGRTAGNALGQSYCLLNNRASKEFMEKVRTSKYNLTIKPCAHIHDAQYYLIKDNLNAVMFTNTHLVKAVYWQDLPDIKHDTVKLGGELSLFYPTWAEELVIPNNATENDILSLVQKHIE